MGLTGQAGENFLDLQQDKFVPIAIVKYVKFASNYKL